MADILFLDQSTRYVYGTSQQKDLRIQSQIVTVGWAMMDGCWVQMVNDSVGSPPQFRDGLERPGVRIIGRVQRLSVDTTQFVHGEEWTRVKDGGTIPEDVIGTDD
ncbi:SubName: Full=Uncharacterized protein {ECO:0000313/EMBL:CCA76372.1} [Serendipita indica DSM 11827]|nr:SubName: Full=Uncharacterized protein {ECO:0000313/EMBL:CCA76372.1} [Serendipita indica DSM 11827]